MIEYLPAVKKLFSLFIKSDKDKIIEILKVQLDKCEKRQLHNEKIIAKQDRTIEKLRKKIKT